MIGRPPPMPRGSVRLPRSLTRARPARAAMRRRLRWPSLVAVAIGVRGCRWISMSSKLVVPQRESTALHIEALEVGRSPAGKAMKPLEKRRLGVGLISVNGWLVALRHLQLSQATPAPAFEPTDPIEHPRIWQQHHRNQSVVCDTKEEEVPPGMG